MSFKKYLQEQEIGAVQNSSNPSQAEKSTDKVVDDFMSKPQNAVTATKQVSMASNDSAAKQAAAKLGSQAFQNASHSSKNQVDPISAGADIYKRVTGKQLTFMRKGMKK